MKKTELKKLIRTLIKEQKANMSRGRLTPQQEAMVSAEIKQMLRNPELGLSSDQQEKGFFIWLGLFLGLVGKIIWDNSGGGSGGGGGDFDGGDYDIYLERKK
jgi:hypothetical protein